MILVVGGVPDHLPKHDADLKAIGIYIAASLNEAVARISVDLI